MYYCTVCSYVEKECVERHHHMIRADRSFNFMQWFHTSDYNSGSQKVGLDPQGGCRKRPGGLIYGGKVKISYCCSFY